MKLQLILLLVGSLIVGWIAWISLRRARSGVPNRRPAARDESDVDDAPIQESAARIEPAGNIDLNAADAPLASTGKRALRIDPTLIPPDPDTEDRFDDELQSIEDVASMPLNLNPGFDRPRDSEAGDLLQALAVPDEKIDFVIHLPGNGPVMRDKALGIYKQNEFDLDKPRSLYGQRYKTSYWSNLEHDSGRTEYGDLALAIQTVDPRGPIDETELNTFVQLGLKLADGLSRHPKLPLTLEQGLERATELQKFCDTFDVIAQVNVMSRGGAFGGRDVEKVARNLGLVFGPMSIFHMPNESPLGCRHLFSMANMFQPGEFDAGAWDRFATTGLTMFMSVPCAHQPVQVFDQMVKAARALARELNGRVLDQDRRPLTEEGSRIIRTQIDRIGDDMRAQGIVAGSSTALRLFADGRI